MQPGDTDQNVQTGGSTDTGTENLENNKTFTQDEVDKIVADRLTRERKKLESKAAADVEKARISSLTDQEKAIEQAKSDARKEVLQSSSRKVAAARIKAELSGVVNDPDAIVEDLNLDKYLTDDFDVDDDAVKILVNKYKSMMDGRRKSPNTLQPGRTSAPGMGSPKADFIAMLEGNKIL